MHENSSHNIQPKLYMLLLGSKAPKRNVEQHDYFFGIATSLKELVPEIKAFWPEAGASIHVDGWREVNQVDGYEIKILQEKQPISQLSINYFSPTWVVINLAN